MFLQKIKELYKLFDFEGSGSIDFEDLFLALQSTIFGFSKFLGFPIPSHSSVRALAADAFKLIDTEHDDMYFYDPNKISIKYNEFSEWIINDDEIQEFLANNLKYQTKNHALKLYQKYYESYMKSFKVAASCSCAALKEEKKLEGSKPKQALRSYLRQNMLECKEEWISEEMIDIFLDIVDTRKSGVIDLSCYKDAMYKSPN